MFRSDLFKLSVTLVLLVATAFVSVAAVAADDSGTIRLVKAAPALGGTADDWYGQGRSPANASGAAVVSDWFERHPDSIVSGDAAMSTLQPTLDSARLDSLNGKPSVDLAMPLQPTLDSARLASLNGGLSAGLATLDNPSNQWIGPETVSAALSQPDDSNGHWIGPETVSAVLGQLQP